MSEDIFMYEPEGMRVVCVGIVIHFLLTALYTFLYLSFEEFDILLISVN